MVRQVPSWLGPEQAEDVYLLLLLKISLRMGSPVLGGSRRRERDEEILLASLVYLKILLTQVALRRVV